MIQVVPTTKQEPLSPYRWPLRLRHVPLATFSYLGSTHLSMYSHNGALLVQVSLKDVCFLLPHSIGHNTQKENPDQQCSINIGVTIYSKESGHSQT